MMKLIDDVGFDASFSFIFSPRPGTPAAALHDDTPHAVKLARLQQLQAVIDDNVAAHRREPRRHGAARAGRRRLAQGRERADGPHRVQPRGQLRRATPRLVGQMVDLRITALAGLHAARRGRDRESHAAAASAALPAA